MTYVNTLGASDALEYQQQHEVQGHKVNIEPAFTWNQPSADLDRYEVDHKEPPLSTETKKLYQEIQATLNDDCIYQVMGHLNVFDLITMAKFGPTFLRVVKQIRTLIICRCNGNPITLMELRSILHVLGLGSSVVNLTISLKSFNSSSQRFICDRLFQYIGGQLKSLTLDSFGVTVEQFELMKPLLFRLIYLDIDFSYNFDYRRFNCEWPNLQVLRIRSSGYIDTFIDQIDSVPEFPRLKKLMIASGYRLHANLFERLHRVCAKITDLVVISVDDYYSEMSPLVLRNTDLDNLSRFTELKRLHLSFSRSYLKDTIINVICSLRHLKYLTLEITNVRLQEDRAVIDTINRNLRRIGMCLINIKEIQLSGIMLNEDHLLEMITSAPSLESLCIHECGYQMTEHCIRSVISYRSNLSMGNHPPLKIIVDEFINKNCPLKRAIENVSPLKIIHFKHSIDLITFDLSMFCRRSLVTRNT